MSDGLLDRAWRGFAELAVAADASEGQRREMQRVFYAGALAVVNAITDAAAANAETPLPGIDDELRRFLADIDGGNNGP